MAGLGKRMGSDATALQKSSEPMPTDAAKVMPERSAVRESESVKTATTVSPSESEIAEVAYQLWLADGCPVGSDQEDWFRAEAALKDAPVAKCEDLLSRPSLARRDTRTGAGMVAEFGWRGHWEAWEMEWGDARWIWDESTPGVGVSNRAG